MNPSRYLIPFIAFCSLLGLPLLLMGQCPGLERDTLGHQNFENGLGRDWTTSQPSDGGKWKIDGGKIGYFENPGSGKWLYLNDEEKNDIGKGEIYSPYFDLSGRSGEVYAEFDLLFEAFEDSSFFRLEIWDGRDWVEFMYLREDFSGRLQIDLTGINHPAVQLRFTYDDEGAWAWGMGIDNVLLYGIAASCGNGICDSGENPEGCPGDCEAKNGKAPYWIDAGKDLEGKTVSYHSFNHQSACDDCSQLIPLGFSFSFFDTSYDQVYLNSNGNLTFEDDYVAYTPAPFCLDGPRMIAPFFGDVDISKGGKISFYADPDRHYFIVSWENVRYFGCEGNCEQSNSFQLILTDGSIRSIRQQLVPPSTNVIFNYGDMQWTTGNSSGGSGGFGGSAATVGLNLGDEVICMDYGTFDSEGFGYRGNSQEMNCPPNEVSHLDFRSLAWDANNGQVLTEKDIPQSNTIQPRGSLQSSQAQIKWTMADTTYTREFILMRGDSEEGLYEIQRASIREAFREDSQYFELTDPQPIEGHTYYRIIELLANGEENPSRLLFLNKEESPAYPSAFRLISAGPNPFSNYLNIELENVGQQDVRCLITNQVGQVVYHDQLQLSDGKTRLSLPELPRGKYFLSLQHPSGTAGVKLIRN